ncbi:hypothetical protein [Curtobacterium sp. VKM Ac-2922]|uniref:hypothetical protein n=1 Tax=Curtobacterium sp. VKM Ac-2922 TaxID=2929475 RepID=UPI001FB53EEC|nr:hypothetical protein [Curtobacterium sp. VKM Ac-2922]MCJ1714086.1 hypothetical protein [Curtobacterium sp. VKM Ac-2922]
MKITKNRLPKVLGASALITATVLSGMAFGPAADAADLPPVVKHMPLAFELSDGTFIAPHPVPYTAPDGTQLMYSKKFYELPSDGSLTYVDLIEVTKGRYAMMNEAHNQCYWALKFSTPYVTMGSASSTESVCADASVGAAYGWGLNANGTLVNIMTNGLALGVDPDFKYQYNSESRVALKQASIDDPSFASLAGSQQQNGGFNAQGVASSATIKAGEQQDVAFGMKADAAVTKLTNTTVEAKAPSGTTFTAGQTTLTGKYRASASDAWSDDKTFTVSGSVMASGSLFRGTITDVDGAKIAAGSELQWKVNVAAPANAKDDQQDLDFTASGKTNAGDFTVTGKSPVTITADNSGVNNPFSVDAPIDGSEHKGENTRFSGKGSAGQKITLHVDNFATADVTTTVKQDGTWDVNKYTGTGEYKFTITQTDNGTANGSKSLTINPSAAPINNPFSVDAPMDGSDHKGEDTVFSGKGSAGQQVTVHVDNFPSVDVTTTVKNNGTWSVVKHTGVGEYKLTVTQKNGATANGSKSLTVNPSAAPINNPFSVDAPVDGSDHKGEDTTFSGKGSAGQQVTIHVDNFQSVDVTTTVKNDGTWSVNKHTGTGEYKITVTQKDGATANGSKSLTINPANAPVVLPFDVTSPKTNTTGYKGEWVEFTGTGTPGRTVTLKVTNFTSVSPSVVVQNDGHWSLKKTIGSGHYDITIDQADGDGMTDTKSLSLN